MVVDIRDTTTATIKALNPQSANDIRNAGQQIVKMSEGMFAKTKCLRTFLFERVYRSDAVMDKGKECYEKINVLFAYYFNDLRTVAKWERFGYNRYRKDSANYC